MQDPEEDQEPITVACNGCEATEEVTSFSEARYHPWIRHDAYGLCTGCYCDACYDSDKYPYRKDRYYDPAYAGERMDDDY